MSKPKWTPGPWRVDGRWLLGADGHATLAELFDPRGGPCAEESEANARLIAAAPELAEVARLTAEHFTDTDAPFGKLAAAALAKARGEMPAMTRIGTFALAAIVRASNRHAGKPACDFGHPFDAANTVFTLKGERQCRECCRRRQREWVARRAGGEVPAHPSFGRLARGRL